MGGILDDIKRVVREEHIAILVIGAALPSSRSTAAVGGAGALAGGGTLRDDAAHYTLVQPVQHRRALLQDQRIRLLVVFPLFRNYALPLHRQRATGLTEVWL